MHQTSSSFHTCSEVNLNVRCISYTTCQYNLYNDYHFCVSCSKEGHPAWQEGLLVCTGNCGEVSPWGIWDQYKCEGHAPHQVSTVCLHSSTIMRVFPSIRPCSHATCPLHIFHLSWSRLTNLAIFLHLWKAECGIFGHLFILSFKFVDQTLCSHASLGKVTCRMLNLGFWVPSLGRSYHNDI